MGRLENRGELKTKQGYILHQLLQKSSNKLRVQGGTRHNRYHRVATANTHLVSSLPLFLHHYLPVLCLCPAGSSQQCGEKEPAQPDDITRIITKVHLPKHSRKLNLQLPHITGDGN